MFDCLHAPSKRNGMTEIVYADTKLPFGVRVCDIRVERETGAREKQEYQNIAYV